MRNRWLPILVLLCAGAGVASAQQYGPPPPPGRGYYAPPPPGIHRFGLVFGGAIGPGAFSFSDCSGCDAFGALALQLEIGGMVSPEVAILFDWTGHLHPTGDGNGTLVSSNLLDVAVRGFLGRIFWLEGGIGIGYLSVSDAYGFTDSSDFGLGLMAAAGVEVLQTYNFALDLSIRLSGEHIYENPSGVNISAVAFLVGFHWY
jgi:hypothetical protein